MADLRGFNAQTVEPNESFDPLPAGEYLCVITRSEDKPTKAGTGSYLELEFEVIEGPHKGRKLWDRLNLANPSEVAVKIAQATLSAICRAVGVLEPKDSCELHDLPLQVKVRVEKRADTDESVNVIKGYRSKQAAAGTAPVAPPERGTAPRSSAAGPANPSVPPWKRN